MASIIALAHLFFFACSSATNKAAVPDLHALLERADALRTAGSTDTVAYAKLSADLGELAQQNAEYCSGTEDRQRVAEFIAGYGTKTCSLNVAEPQEQLFTTRGFASPVRVSADCAAGAPFVFEADSRSMRLTGEGMKFTDGALNAKIRIETADPNAAHNTITFSARFYADALLQKLATDCNAGVQFGIRLRPPEYRVLAMPDTGADSYGNLRKSFRRAEFESSSGGASLKAETALAANGQFTVGIKSQGRSFDLTYGHPNGQLPDGIGTTFTTVRIDGTDFRFEKQTLSRSRREDGALIAEATVPKSGIKIRQVLRPEEQDGQPRVLISYEIENTSRRAHSVGLRLLIDTWAGTNDGVPFLVPGDGTPRLLRNEFEFTPATSLLWQTYDPQNTPAADAAPALEGIMTGQGLTPPDRIALVNWAQAVNTPWYYAPSTDRRITGDSAAALWWLPAEIKPGTKQLIATAVGARLRAHQTEVFITDPAQGDILIYLWYKNQSSERQNISFKISAQNGDLRCTDKEVGATVEPGAIFARALPAQIFAEQDAAVVIDETSQATTRQLRFPVRNAKKWQRLAANAVAEPQHEIPVSYFDTRELELVARLVDASGREVVRLPLVRHPIDGGYEYAGKLLVPAVLQPGRYSIEVVR